LKISAVENAVEAGIYSCDQLMHAGKLKAFDSLSNFYSVASHAVFATLIGVPEKRTKAVKRRYDLFEVLPDGSVRWRCTVEGHEQAMSTLRKLAALTPNELRLMHLPTQNLIARMNEKAE